MPLRLKSERAFWLNAQVYKLSRPMQNDSVTSLRIKLDEAITYGTVKFALSLARDSLRYVRAKNLPAEVEYFKAQIDILNKNYVAAIEHLDKTIAYNPKDGAAYNDRALCLVELGIIDEAIAYFDKGIAVEPDYATIYHNKGWLLSNLGRHTEAIRYFKKALGLEPDRAVTYENLADALFNLSDYAGAVAAYRRVLQLLKPGSCRSIRKQIKEEIIFLEKIKG